MEKAVGGPNSWPGFRCWHGMNSISEWACLAAVVSEEKNGSNNANAARLVTGFTVTGIEQECCWSEAGLGFRVSDFRFRV